MARGKGKGDGRATNKSSNFGGYKFINVRLSTRDKEAMAETELDVEFPLESILELMAEGYKFSGKEDRNNNTFVASLTDDRPDSPSYKTILTGRGSSPLNAWYSLAYRHIVLMADGWEEFIPDSDDSDFD